MSLPNSGPISLGDVAAELGIGLPLSLGDPRVLALAGKSAPPISLSDLYGIGKVVVTGHDDTQSIYTGSGNGTGSCSPYVTIAGGRAPYAYLWEFESNPHGFTMAGNSGPSCTISHTFGKNGTEEISATLRCTVTDGTGRSVTLGGITGTLVFYF